MGYEALEQIHLLANERFNLYRMAAQQHLTPTQLQRLHEIENDLPVLWDQHRREVATRYWGRGGGKIARERVSDRVFDRDIA
jgi:hypothetical protein